MIFCSFWVDFLIKDGIVFFFKLKDDIVIQNNYHLTYLFSSFQTQWFTLVIYSKNRGKYIPGLLYISFTLLYPFSPQTFSCSKFSISPSLVSLPRFLLILPMPKPSSSTLSLFFMVIFLFLKLTFYLLILLYYLIYFLFYLLFMIY